MNEGENRELFSLFSEITVKELEDLLLAADGRDERIFYRMLLNLKLQISQEKIIGKALL